MCDDAVQKIEITVHLQFATSSTRRIMYNRYRTCLDSVKFVQALSQIVLLLYFFESLDTGF